MHELQNLVPQFNFGRQPRKTLAWATRTCENFSFGEERSCRASVVKYEFSFSISENLRALVSCDRDVSILYDLEYLEPRAVGSHNSTLDFTGLVFLHAGGAEKAISSPHPLTTRKYLLRFT